MKRSGWMNLVLASAALAPLPRPLFAAVPMPAQADIDKATAGIKSNDDAQVAAAIKQIHVWLDGGRPVRNVWTEWGPDLMKENRNQDAADLLLDECIQRADGGLAALSGVRELAPYASHALHGNTAITGSWTGNDRSTQFRGYASPRKYPRQGK